MRRVRATTIAVEKKRVTYSECAFLALGIQHAVRMRHTVTCDLSGSILFPHYLKNSLTVGKNVIEQNACLISTNSV
jgi:hypothetical protein